MFKRLMIGIFTLSLVAIFWTEANALVSNCKPGTANCNCVSWSTSGGTKYCTTWRTGSEVCNVEITGLSSEAAPSAFVRCEVDEPTPGDGIPGTVFCIAPEVEFLSTSHTTANDACRHHFNGNGTGHENATPGHVGDCESSPLTLTAANSSPFPPSNETVGVACDKKGVCQATLEVDPDSCTSCCPEGTVFVTFTADVFVGRTTFCPTGEEGSCVELESLCRKAGNNYNCDPIVEPPPPSD